MVSIKKSDYNNLPEYEVGSVDPNVVPGNLIKVPSAMAKKDNPEDKVMLFEITDEGDSKIGMKLLYLNLVEG